MKYFVIMNKTRVQFLNYSTLHEQSSQQGKIRSQVDDCPGKAVSSVNQYLGNWSYKHKLDPTKQATQNPLYLEQSFKNF
jgi:hypothetical protein